MTLKSKLVVLLKALKNYRNKIVALRQENQALRDELRLSQERCKLLTEEKDALKMFEPLLTPELSTLIAEAEEQSTLVNETIREMDTDAAPDLDAGDRLLLSEFYHDPTSLIPAESEAADAEAPVGEPIVA